ncbi:MAG: aminopeptidase N [Spirochaetales bacterium]|nr:aminopeptidase N [Spirochaetales bacterium]
MKKIYLKDYTPPAWLVDEILMEFTLDEEITIVQSRLKMKKNPGSSDKSLRIVLDGKELNTRSVSLDGKELTASSFKIEKDRGTDRLVIENNKINVTVETVVEVFPSKNTALSGLYYSGGLLTTQCESEEFRRITWFPDRPDVMARFDVTLIAEKAKYPVLLSNGNPVEKKDLPDGKHSVRWQDPFPKPAYIFALVAGKLERIESVFTTKSGKKVDLHIYGVPKDIPKLDWAMDCLKRAMKWDEDTFGLEYDLNLFQIVSVPDFNFGAMENKGLNIFNSSVLLADPDTTTYAGYKRIDSVIAHEYFHNYTGDRVTLRDWFQLSLKEGLTVYRDSLYSSDMYSADMGRIQAAQTLRAGQFAEDAGPNAHPVRPESYVTIDNFYTTTVYRKGAEVLRMLEDVTGKEKFNRGIREYLKRFDGKCATLEDFVGIVAEVTGTDLKQFMLWFSQAGTPEVTLSESYDEVKNEFTIRAKQGIPRTPGQDRKLPMHIPLRTGLIDDNGVDLVSTVLHLKEPEQTWTFPGVNARPVVSCPRRFSAPVKLHTESGMDELLFRIRCDGDAFSKWDAVQSVGMLDFNAIIEKLLKGEKPQCDRRYPEALVPVISDPGIDGELKAAIMFFPSMSFLETYHENIVPEIWIQARRFQRMSFCGILQDTLSGVFDSLYDPDETFSMDEAACSRRALRNAAINRLMYADTVKYSGRCYEYYVRSNNISDRLAALAGLCNSDSPEREKALADFYDRYKDNEVVLPSWFMLQAGMDDDDVLDKVKELTRHPAFIKTRPNHIRALIGVFASNYFQYHRNDGSGYTFLADWVMRLDPMNPGVAARLALNLTTFKKYAAPNYSLMKKELERIIAVPGLSKNTHEVVGNALA